MTFFEHLTTSRGNVLKAQRAFIRERGWQAEDWYRAWQDSDLPQEVEAAVTAWVNSDPRRSA